MLSDVEGKVAVITGAGSGIGRALVLLLAREGMHVVAADVEAGALDATAALAAGAAGGGAEVVTVVTDVADAGSVDALAASTFERFGATHLLCNNAGVFQGGVLWERTDAELDWVLGVNLFGILNGIRSFVPRMLAAGEPGHVVNTASMAGLVALPYSGPYVISKFAAVAASEVLAQDLLLAGAPIGVSVLCPSLIATGIGTSHRNAPAGLRDRAQGPDVELVEQALRESTTGEGLPPEEVAPMVLDAVRAGRFWIGTKPSFDDQVRERTAALLARELPPMPTID